MASLTIVPASGSITAKQSACRVNVTSAEDNRTPDNTGGAFAYYLLFDNPSGDDGKSYKFNVSADGKHEFNSYVFPNSGAWTVRLRDASNDGDIATLAVTVA